MINLVDFELFGIERFHSTFHFREDRDRHFLLTDALEVHFIEFPKFEKVSKNKSNALHRWLMFLDEKLEWLSADESVRVLAEAREKAQHDWDSSMKASKKEGILIGRREGHAEGKAEVIAKLLQSGMPASRISESEIERIAEEGARG